MSQQHTYAAIANDWALWSQSVNTDASMTREEFDGMDPGKKIALLARAFGPESFRAAYIASGSGLLLTTKEDAGLPDDELLAVARSIAEDVGAEGEILIGEWQE